MKLAGRMNERRYFDYFLLLAIGFIWGAQFIFNKIALHYFASLTIATARIVFGWLTLTILLWFSPKVISNTKSQPFSAIKLWAQYALIGFFEAVLPFFLVVWGQQRVSSSIAAILMGTIPLFTMGFAMIWVKDERWSVGKALSVLLGFWGIVVLVNPMHNGIGNGNIAGELAILAGSTSFALSIILLKKLPLRSPVAVVRNILFIAAVPMVIITMIIDRPWQAHFDFTGLLAVAVLGIFCSGIVYVFYVFLIQRSGPTFASLSNYLVPLFGVLFGISFGKEIFHLNEVIALFIILLALAIATLPLRRFNEYQKSVR